MEVKETFLCTFCGKGFTKKANLESHITLHTGEKRYSCTQCDKKFRSHSVYQVTSLRDQYLIATKNCLFPEPSAVSQGQKGVCLHLLWKGIHAEVSPSKTHGHSHRREEPHMSGKIGLVNNMQSHNWTGLPENFHRAWWCEEAHENSQQRKHKVSLGDLLTEQTILPKSLELLSLDRVVWELVGSPTRLFAQLLFSATFKKFCQAR